MFEYTVKNDINKCWDNAHSAKINEVDAFLQYLSYLVLKPAEMLITRYFIEAAYVSVIALPATIPIAVLSSPVFFVSRRVSMTKEKVNEFLQNRKEQKLKDFLNSNQTESQKQISPQIWQKAVQQASTKLFIQNKKRMIVVGCLSEFSSTEENKKYEKEFIFILDENKTLFDVLYLLKKQIKSQSDSIYLIMDSKILNSATKILALKSNQLGIIQLNYTKICIKRQ